MGDDPLYTTIKGVRGKTGANTIEVKWKPPGAKDSDEEDEVADGDEEAEYEEYYEEGEEEEYDPECEDDWADEAEDWNEGADGEIKAAKEEPGDDEFAGQEEDMQEGAEEEMCKDTAATLLTAAMNLALISSPVMSRTAGSKTD